MTISQAFDYLHNIRLFGSKLGLTSISELTKRMGFPQKHLRFLHIAGTNGKGSTATFLESLLRHAGYRVGLFTSPHLIQFGERIQIDRQPMSLETLAERLEELQPLIEDISREFPQNLPTFFEVVTALALLEFHRQQVDWVVWECGLGGRLDATNIVTPEVTIITSIGRDHTTWLGSTLQEIASEKAGIIKPSVPCITSVQNPEALAVLRHVAQEKKAPLLEVTGTFEKLLPLDDSITPPELLQSIQFHHQSFSTRLLGMAQPHNAACALTALEMLEKQGEIHITDQKKQEGLRKAFLPGRFQLMQHHPPFVIDGAHNVEAIQITVQTWQAFFPNNPPLILCGLLQDKPIEGILHALLPLAQEICFVGVKNGRQMDPQQLQAKAQALLSRTPKASPLPLSSYTHLQDFWPQIKPRLAAGQPLLITGSLFLAGESLAHWQGIQEELLWNEK